MWNLNHKPYFYYLIKADNSSSKNIQKQTNKKGEKIENEKKMVI